MTRADDEKRGLSWLRSHGIREDHRYALATFIAAVRAEAYETAEKACERRSSWAGIPERDFDRGYVRGVTDCEADIRDLKEAT